MSAQARAGLDRLAVSTLRDVAELSPDPKGLSSEEGSEASHRFSLRLHGQDICSYTAAAMAEGPS